VNKGIERYTREAWEKGTALEIMRGREGSTCLKSELWHMTFSTAAGDTNTPCRIKSEKEREGEDSEVVEGGERGRR
tara:strand:- start:150 stop:377 length:228 start_codon:yes stop_codon:yes gene_type:complete